MCTYNVSQKILPLPLFIVLKQFCELYFSKTE